ncbi:DNA polymerase epsilon subunit 3 [Mycena kentingensis (nom. inval.)]|nr:DNA polymerase epsilon subunit 3 [Mycena kentingensis (nom. inval.)]
MPRKDAGGSISAQAQQDLISEGIEQFELPKSIVTRIAKSALPENAKMQKETVLSLVKGSTVFINYLAATQVSPHDVALSKQHKSISASDVLKALETIEFGDLVDKLQGELNVYRELAKTDKSKKGISISANIPAPKGKAAAAAAAAAASSASASNSAASTPAPPSVKGKERATIVLPKGAFSSANVGTPAGESISSGRMEVDDEDGDRQDEEEDEEDPVDDVGDEEDEEELVDTVAQDMEDVRRDARGLEDAAMEE